MSRIRNAIFTVGDSLMELGVSAAIVGPALVIGVFASPGKDRTSLAITTGASALGFMATLPISAPLYSTGYILSRISGVQNR